MNTRGMNIRILKKIVISTLCLVPFLILVVRAATFNLGANPVQALMLSSGDWTMRILLAMLAVTPVSRLTGWKKVEWLRRPLGLFALFYVCVHFMIYIGIDYFFKVGLIVHEALKNPSVIVGFGVFLIIVLLGITSFRSVMRRMDAKCWKIIHRLVYVVGVGGVVHYLLKVKVIPVELIVYTSILLVLLLFRIAWFLIKGGTLIPAVKTESV